MPGHVKVTAVAVLLAAASACGSRHSAGFRLPDYGDPEKGRVAFVQFQCFTCHEVQGEDFPQVPGKPAVQVRLGGTVERAMSDGYLVASIIHPSYRFAPYPRKLITRDGESRMPHYDDAMTVRQLTDIVAFLQSRYTVVHPVARYHNLY
jgi:hypothetical protein